MKLLKWIDLLNQNILRLMSSNVSLVVIWCVVWWGAMLDWKKEWYFVLKTRQPEKDPWTRPLPLLPHSSGRPLLGSSHPPCSMLKLKSIVSITISPPSSWWLSYLEGWRAPRRMTDKHRAGARQLLSEFSFLSLIVHDTHHGTRGLWYEYSSSIRPATVPHLFRFTCQVVYWSLTRYLITDSDSAAVKSLLLFRLLPASLLSIFKHRLFWDKE